MTVKFVVKFETGNVSVRLFSTLNGRTYIFENFDDEKVRRIFVLIDHQFSSLQVCSCNTHRFFFHCLIGLNLIFRNSYPLLPKRNTRPKRRLTSLLQVPVAQKLYATRSIQTVVRSVLMISQSSIWRAYSGQCTICHWHSHLKTVYCFRMFLWRQVQRNVTLTPNLVWKFNSMLLGERDFKNVVRMPGVLGCGLKYAVRLVHHEKAYVNWENYYSIIEQVKGISAY
jgi:hypothetical protein